MSRHVTLRSVLNAVVDAQQIGAVHACYILSGQPMVHSSRTVEIVNAFRREEMTSHPIVTDEAILLQLPGNSTALSSSCNTHIGKRKAYYTLYMLQLENHGVANFNFSSFLSSYVVKKNSAAIFSL